MTDLARVTLAGAGMELAKWKTSCPAVRSHLQATGVDIKDFDTQSAGLFKVLGISWNTESDMFHFRMPDSSAQLESTAVTKRSALSIIAAAHDPLGWIIPFSVRGKLLIQRLWSTNLQWDDPLPADVHRDLKTWVSEFQSFRHHSIPRRFSTRAEEATSHHLHLFGDASQRSFAAVAYIEYRYADETSEFALAMCKSRVAPRDPQTLPRLELLTALIAVRLRRFLSDRLDINFASVRYYTDSKIAYHWATSSRPGAWKQFICSRVTEIQTCSNPSE